MVYEFMSALKTYQRVGDFRLFEPITFDYGKIYLSIQGSKLHYCEPRETLPLGLYKSLEVKVVGVVPIGWEECHSENGIFYNVPIKKIEELYRYLVKHHKRDKTRREL